MNSPDFIKHCQKYSIWVIKYNTPSFTCPVFLIYYTDDDESDTDRLLCYENGKVWGICSLKNLAQNLEHQISLFPNSNKLKSWLKGFKDLEVLPDAYFDIPVILEALQNKQLNNAIITEMANFNNLCYDFTNSNPNNEFFKPIADDPILTECLDLYYDNILFPKIDNGPSIEPPYLNIDELLSKFNLLFKSFDSTIIISDI